MENKSENTKLIRNKYRFIKNLGGGSFSNVKLIKDLEGNTHILKETKNDIDDIKAQSRECQCLLAIRRHPCVISIVDAFILDKKICIVTNYAEKGDLQRYLKEYKKPIGLEIAQQWFVQLLLGLHALHEKNIIHRDVKPANVFILQDNRLILGDLGSSKKYSEKINIASEVPMTSNGGGNNMVEFTLVGTPLYLAPEMINSSYNHSYKIDIWSLGCVFYEIFSVNHERLFKNVKNLMSLTREICKGPLPHCFQAPLIESEFDEMANIIRKEMIVVNPNNRLSTTQLLQHSVSKKAIMLFLYDVITCKYKLSEKNASILFDQIAESLGLKSIVKLALKMGNDATSLSTMSSSSNSTKDNNNMAKSNP